MTSVCLLIILGTRAYAVDRKLNPAQHPRWDRAKAAGGKQLGFMAFDTYRQIKVRSAIPHYPEYPLLRTLTPTLLF